MKVLVALAALMIAPVMATNSQPRELCHGFIPQNNWAIPNDYADANTGITQDQFNAVVTRMNTLYTAEVAARGGVLNIKPLWDNATVNSSAQQTGKQYIINMYGGLARYHGMTPDAEALVACHEMGHHLGGAPKFQSWGGTPEWGTVEGGADYYAGLKCLRRYFAMDQNNIQIVQAMKVDPTVQTSCGSQFQNPNDQAICARAAQAGMVVAQVFHDLSGDAKEPAFNTPDPSVVKQTFEDHPATQCRLDTYFQSALCTAPVASPVSDTDYTQGSCSEVHGDKIGNRSKCWFAANNTRSGQATTPSRKNRTIAY